MASNSHLSRPLSVPFCKLSVNPAGRLTVNYVDMFAEFLFGVIWIFCGCFVVYYLDIFSGVSPWIFSNSFARINGHLYIFLLVCVRMSSVGMLLVVWRGFFFFFFRFLSGASSELSRYFVLHFHCNFCIFIFRALSRHFSIRHPVVLPFSN